MFVPIGKANRSFVAIKSVLDINIRSIVNIAGTIVFLFKELKFECAVWFVFFSYFFAFLSFIKNNYPIASLLYRLTHALISYSLRYKECT